MGLHFLNFDYSEDDEGRASWDAVASVAAARLPELVQEIVGLLAWAHAEFGALQCPARKPQCATCPLQRLCRYK